MLMVKESNPADPEAVDAIIAYHDRTKHHPQRYARGPGNLDWATQPDPFRRFNGSPVLKLPLADRDDTPAAAILSGAGTGPPSPGFRLHRISTRQANGHPPSPGYGGWGWIWFSSSQCVG
jgi:hypothetical protein